MGVAASSPEACDFDSKDLYEIFEIEEDATIEQVKTAYRVQVLKHHPDRNIDDADGATARFQRIQQAYQILTDPNRRREYDAERLRAKSQDDVPKPTHSDAMPGEWCRNEPQPTQSWSEWFGSWVGLGGRCPAKFDFERYRKLRPLYFRMSVVNDFDVPDEGINLDDIANFFQYLKTCGDLEFTDSNDEPGKKNAYDVYGNFFACIAYDEIALMTPHCIEIPPDFGCPHCSWNMNDMVYVGVLNAACPSFTSDFYEYWTRFSTRKAFRAYVKYIIPENTLPHDAKFMRRENRDFQHEMRKKYNSVIRDLARSLMKLDPRYILHNEISEKRRREAPPPEAAKKNSNGNKNNMTNNNDKKRRRRRR